MSAREEVLARIRAALADGGEPRRSGQRRGY